MFLSIIVPVYNIKDYLVQCVDSLVNQDITDYEILLIDDGATDGSGDLCDELAENNDFVSVVHKINGGLSDARNAGIRQAKGDYILFIDGDDYIQKNCLAKLIENWKQQNCPELMFLTAHKVYPSGKQKLVNEEMEQDKIVGRSKEEVLNYIAQQSKYPAAAWAKLVSKKLLLQNQFFFEYGITSEDLDWTRNLLFAAKSFGYSSDNFYYYRQQRAGSITSSHSFKNFNNICIIIERWLKDAEPLKEDEQKILYSFACYEYKILLGILQNYKGEDRKKGSDWLKKYKWLLKYRDDKQIKMITFFVNLFGIDITSRLLRYYLIQRRK